MNKKLIKSLLVMADVIEARDPYTGGHVWRVSQFSKLLAVKIGLPNREAIHMSLGGYIHDLGKVGIPDSILCKAGPLDDCEFDIIKTHPLIGATLIASHPLAELVYAPILQHHERPDGMGYPNRLDKSQIALAARVVAVADAFDAMTSLRSYRNGMSLGAALQRLEQGAASQFDPELTGHMRALGDAGDLSHIAGHGAPGIPLVTCPHCGPIVAIPRATRDGDIIYCRACHGELRLHRNKDTFIAEMTGMTDDPQKLLPAPNMEVVEELAGQVAG